MSLLGTDARRFHVPPNGGRGLGILAEMEERCFCRPPDLELVRQVKMMDGLRPVSTVDTLLEGATLWQAEIGTDVRRFCHLPDPSEADSMWLGSPRWIVAVGTDERGFWVPPNGSGGTDAVVTDVRRFRDPPDPWRVASCDETALVLLDLAETEERRFRVPPDGGR